MSISTTIIILIILVILSAFFSATETAFTCANRIKLKNLANNGDKKAEKTLEVIDDYSKFLSTILIGNNIVNIFATSLATALFVKLFADDGVTISTVVMTIVILIFGEIMPKNLAKLYPEKFAISVTSVVSFLCVIFRPLTFIFEKLEKLFTRKANPDDGAFTSEEFVTLVEEAEEKGTIKDDEADLITNSVEFNDIEVNEIFTPRVNVIAVEINQSFDEIEKVFRESGYSRLPCYEESLDHIVGILHQKDFYYIYYNKTSTNLRQILQKVVYTAEHVKISVVLKYLQNEKSHLAVVLDEYGGTAGIITMEDILEELVGEIYDEHDEVVEYYKKIDKNTYEVKGDLDIEDMFEYFGIKVDFEYEFNTVSAWVIYNMKKIPQKGDKFDFFNLTVEVLDSDEKLVNKVKITVNEKVEDN